MPCLALRRRPLVPSIPLAPRPWSALITTWLSAWRRQRYARACFSTLARLDDSLLRDIGLARGDLASAAAQLVDGERPKGWR